MKKVYIILKNADMTEGRGPMVLTGEAFTDLERAKTHIEKQVGVMGIGGGKARQYSGWQESGTWCANDHEVRTIEVIE